MKQEFLLTLKKEKMTFAGEQGEHILDAMLKAGINKAPKGCHGGGCGVCKIKILKGNVFTLSQSQKYLTQDEQDRGYALACRAFPRSDIVFEFIGKPQCKTDEKKKYGFV